MSLRDPLQLLVGDSQADDSPVVSMGRKKRAHRGVRRVPNRHIKSCIKQVSGGAFCGLVEEGREHEIIVARAEEGARCRSDPVTSATFNRKRLDQSTKRTAFHVESLFEHHVRKILDSFVSRAIDRFTPLQFDIRKNHCQKFCEAIFDYDLFADFIAVKSARCLYYNPEEPPYLMSFVSRFNNVDCFPKKIRPASKKSAPNGLTEEYLLRFRRFDHHTQSDIFDTLNEYWTDWGRFPKRIFPHQRPFL